MTKAREGKVAVPGGSVVWRSFGDGPKTPLLALHGGPGFPSDYLESLQALGDERRVYLYDQLGCGRSDRPTDPSVWTRERFVEELAVVRATLKLDRAHLLGHSWGSMLASEYIFTKSPQGLRSMIFASPCLSAARFAVDVRHLVATLPADAQAAIEEGERTGAFETETYQNAFNAYIALYLARRGANAPEFARAFEGFNLEVYGTMWGPSEFTIVGNLKNFDRTIDLPTLKIPSLFLCGEFDETTPATTRWYASLAPDSQFAEIAGSAHLTTIDAPEATVDLVRRFLSRVEAA